MGTLGICLHYIEIETPQELSSDISKQLNQHLCAAAYADCDLANVNGAAAARSLRFPLAARRDTWGVSEAALWRRLSSLLHHDEETAELGHVGFHCLNTLFLHKHAETFSTLIKMYPWV